jgi:hypothetical protein
MSPQIFDAIRERQAPRGQILVIFAGTITILLLFSALVVDVAWLWSNTLKMQRAADSAALAGAVYLPQDVTGAYGEARNAASRNGYTNGSPGVTVTPLQDVTSNRRLDVRITAPVETFFLRLIGMNEITISRKAKAEYVLPVPMGSPLNYYGVYGLVRTETGSTTTIVPGNTGASPLSAGIDKGGSSSWTNNNNVFTSNDAYARSSTNNTSRSWGNFNVNVPAGAAVVGIEVYVEAKSVDAGCAVQAALSWNNGSSFTSGTSGTDPGLKNAVLTTSDAPYVLGSPTMLWGRSWTPTQLNNANFWVRLTNIDPGSACASNQRIDIDWLRVKVYWETTVVTPDQNVVGPHGETLTPQGFWAVMLSQGADSSSGDAYLPNYVQSSASKLNPEHSTSAYYDYAVETTTGAGGSAYIFDPGFCDQGDFDIGTGDNYYSGSGAVSSFYDLYDTAGTPYNLGDDRHVGSSGNTFRRQTSCDAYHNAWYAIPFLAGQPEASSGLLAGTVYRLRASTFDPTDVAGQNGVSANNGFAIMADATSGAAPKVYGIGAMEMLTPLPGGQTSTFYLAQIEAIHAGKTMEIRLWDPGDTNQNAYIQIQEPCLGGPPCVGGWKPYTTLSYTAVRGQLNPATGSYVFNSGASSCDSNSSASTDRVQTYQSGSKFNGCWLTLEIQIPFSYSAPQDGWWKISYTMQGGAGTNATDITTWQVNIRGNPVHLVEP